MNSLRSAGFARVDIKECIFRTLLQWCHLSNPGATSIFYGGSLQPQKKKKLIQNFELALPVSSVKVYNFLVTTKLKQKAEGISCPTVPHKHIDTFFAVIIAFKAEEPGTNVFTFAIHW